MPSHSDLAAMQYADEEEDINKVLRYFSYKHFYVIYCKFWELDIDHDFLIDRENLIRYGNHSSLNYVFNNGQMDLGRLKNLVQIVGKQRLVLDLSRRKKDGKYAIVTDRWQRFSDVTLDAEVLQFLANFADEFPVHGVDVEGKKLGIDKKLVALLGKHSPIPVNYAGGVTVIANLERIRVVGMAHVDVTVGSALDIFGGNLAYKDVVAWHGQQQVSRV